MSLTRRRLFGSLLAPVVLKRQERSAARRLDFECGTYTLEEIRSKEDAASKKALKVIPGDAHIRFENSSTRWREVSV